jgi:antitoxin component HigA of HigAB toxin-antitoxin module
MLSAFLEGAISPHSLPVQLTIGSRSKGITSEVFHGKRSISKMQAKKLAQFFHVGVELFI